MNERQKSSRAGWLPKWLAPRGLSRPLIGIVSDSASCLPQSYRDRAGLIEVTVPIIVDNHLQGDDPQALMMGLAMGKSVKTSRPAPGEFARAYRALLDAGCHQVLSIHFSGALSGTADAARLAAASFGSAVCVVDSQTVALPLGFALADVLDARDAGAPLEVLKTIAEQSTLNTVYFAVPSLEQLRRGGRISALSSVLGNLLNVKPILTIDQGSITALEKPRSFARAQARLVSLALRDAREVGSNARLGVMHFGAEELATEIATELAPFSCQPVVIESLPAVLAAHTGMGVLAVAVAALDPQPDSEAAGDRTP
ncbi:MULTISPECIES: DegV family protein [Micrococcaceae]|uniref:DegV family protein n=1 Tax=Micrococcaceae TaxID=1268 RepID=UPI001035AB74|nr:MULTISPECIES: DegV family protein [Micrococcaceae]TAP27332.1 DegV family protein [Arthrobacter sp. S41]UXN31059.1 DegV family protein [Glutamicibacter sp. M10]